MLQLSGTWRSHLEPEFKKPYFETLDVFVHAEYGLHPCYPPFNQIFNAFESCAFEAVKVVIIGQDPYHGEGQANGLCFSVNEGMPHPPSLKNIFKELETDLKLPVPSSGDLSPWANQGVLLLNATLSVRAKEAGSHQKHGWEKFTNEVIKTLSRERSDLVFLLWGSFAKNKIRFIDTEKHTVLQTGHPSPLSANRGYWFGNKHFSKTNEVLKSLGKSPIQWG
ncbi:uracil-DNA glycosylase, family 1 [Formosa sp. Hel1_33_131]|uniref:uracil-DNA glycosylase n=1 Tax=Formosa sp. Hel1_33_131 TaxID=1336794 RepID=UPI00084E21C5|nr:uracil-DNA glycosylase [Formosa sp. Hel1_33_131]AOR29297.1 uracil-DNA glycosylase, family 1 [Formosa sp. Hel1_33_131]